MGARVGPGHQGCQWAVLSIKPDQTMHCSGEGERQHLGISQLSNAVSDCAIDGRKHNCRLLHLPTRLGLFKRILAERLGQFGRRAVDGEGRHLHCGRTDIDADDDLSSTGVHITGTGWRRLDE